MAEDQKESLVTGADGGGEHFLHLNVASGAVAEEIVARLRPDNADPEAETKRRGISGGHYIIADLDKNKKTHIAIHAHVFPGQKPKGGIQWLVSFAHPYIVKEMPELPGHYTAALGGPHVKYVEKPEHLDKARELLADRLLEDGIIPAEVASQIKQIKTFPDKTFTKASFEPALWKLFGDNWLKLEGGSPELVERLKASFSPPNGDPKTEKRVYRGANNSWGMEPIWKDTVGWVTSSPEGDVAIKVSEANEKYPSVQFVRPFYVEKNPQMDGHYTVQKRLDDSLKVQGSTDHLRGSMQKLLEKLLAEGFIDQKLAEEITQKHEEFLKRDLESRGASSRINSGSRSTEARR